MMREPDINHYPKWLHRYIQETLNTRGENCHNELLEICRESQKTCPSPLAKVLFYLTIEVIRMQFHIWALHQRLVKAEERRFVPGNFTKEEIQALKACAKQKMSEPTPEQEEEWERDALDDQWGDSL